MSMAGGRKARSSGSRALIRSTVAMTLASAPGRFRHQFEGMPLVNPADRRSSTESIDFRHIGKFDREAIAIGDDESSDSPWPCCT